MVATVLMAKRTGWQVTFPKPLEDAKEGVDLIISKGGVRRELSIHCRTRGVFIISPAPEKPSLLEVEIPATSNFYSSVMIGIPSPKSVESFRQKIDLVVRG